MNNKRWKTILLACGLTFASFVCGCGKAWAKESTEETQPTAVEEAAPETEQEDSAAGEAEVSLKEEALSAYQEILRAAPALEGEHEELADASFDYEQNQKLFGNHYELFALCDIDQDEVPELIALTTVNFRWTPVSVYTYADGAAVLLKDPLNPEAHGTFEQMSTANGAYITYICGDNHIHSVWRGTNPVGETVEDNYAYALEGTVLTAVDCAVGENDSTIYFYDIARENTAENVAAMMQ